METIKIISIKITVELFNTNVMNSLTQLTDVTNTRITIKLEIRKTNES